MSKKLHGRKQVGRGVITAPERTCLRCGCTEHDACVISKRPQHTCAWACAAIDVCTACVRIEEVGLFDEIQDIEAAMAPLQRMHYARCVLFNREFHGPAGALKQAPGKGARR